MQNSALETVHNILAMDDMPLGFSFLLKNLNENRHRSDVGMVPSLTGPQVDMGVDKGGKRQRKVLMLIPTSVHGDGCKIALLPLVSQVE